MAFSSILTFILTAYVIAYIAMMVYDAFIKKDAEDTVRKVDDEDVDISDEAGSFQPVLVRKDNPPVVQPLAEHYEEDVPEEALADNNNADNVPPTTQEGQDKEEKAVGTGLPEEQPTNRKSLNDVDDENKDKEKEEENNNGNGSGDDIAVSSLKEPSQTAFNEDSGSQSSRNDADNSKSAPEPPVDSDNDKDNGQSEERTDSSDKNKVDGFEQATEIEKENSTVADKEDSVDNGEVKADPHSVSQNAQEAITAKENKVGRKSAKASNTVNNTPPKDLPTLDVPEHIVRIDMLEQGTRMYGGETVEITQGEVDKYAEGLNSKLDDLRGVSYAEEDEKAEAELNDAIRQRENDIKNGNTPAPPTSLPSI